MAEAYDVIVVGAGFAGVTAARELRRAGRQVLIAEGRDRIGGRTWTADAMGRRLELGGTWVHWIQPHVWAELSRYGLGVVASPPPVRGYWIADGEVHTGTSDELMSQLDKGMAATTREALTYFPRPFEPLHQPIAREIDELSIQDKIAELNLPGHERDLVEGMWATNFNGSTAAGAYTQALRWCALAAGSWQLMFEACATYKIDGGTIRLIQAMFDDAGAELRLNACVTQIAQDGDSVEVRLADGMVLTARAVIVTSPINALSSISFNPQLSEVKQAVAVEGQASAGLKVWARLRGEYEPFVALAPGSYPFTLAQVEHVGAGETLLVIFGPESSRLEAIEPGAVQEALRTWLPEADILEVAAHDWVDDTFAREGWPMLRPGQLTGALRELQQPEGRVVLAGSDYASGWAGFIDGAIESGFSAARTVAALLADRPAGSRQGESTQALAHA